MRHAWFVPSLMSCAMACVLAGAGYAQERPTLLPTRDVDVTYRSMQSGQPLEQRSRFDATEQRTRLDTPTPGLYMIVDDRARTVALVSDPDHGVVDMALPSSGVPGSPAVAAGDFVRVGADQVAGLPCVEWQTRDTTGNPVIACFTADGVMLRARRGTTVLAIATRVQYGTLDPALFQAPAGYGHVHAPTRAPPQPPP